MNISKLRTFIFRNRTIFWDVSKWNRGQKKWDEGSTILNTHVLQICVTNKNNLDRKMVEIL